MKLLRLLLILGVCGIAHAQETPIYCISSALLQCNQNSQVGTGYQGDPAWKINGKLNAWGAQLGLFTLDPANEVMATPISGTGIPGLRFLVAGDLPLSGVGAGSYTCMSATVDQYGRVTAAANGSCGGGGGGGTTTPGGSNGQLQYNNSNAFGGIAFGTSGYAMVSNGSGVAPSFQQLNLAGGAVTGVTPVANGGTGASTLAGAFLPQFSGSITAGDCVKWLNTTTISDAGAACGSGGGGSGTINTGTPPALGYYAGIGTTISPLTTASQTIADLQATTTFTVVGTGCALAGHTGGPFGGTVTLSSGPCTAVTVTINGGSGFTTTNGYHCTVSDRTAQAAGTWIPNWGESSVTTTTLTIPIPAAAGTSDVISFSCDWN